MAGDPLSFYFDFISPYAYLAWKALPAIAARHGREVRPMPILFAALLDHHGQKGPAEIAAKRAYVFKNCLRHAHLAGVPIAVPPTHPFNPLLALRIASLDFEPAIRHTVIDALFDAVWGGGPGVTDAGVVAGIARAAGAPDDVVQRASSPEIKARVRRQTDDAIALGAFGVPTIACDGELFWGYDALPHVELRLRGEDPCTGQEERTGRWATLQASAERPGAARPTKA